MLHWRGPTAWQHVHGELTNIPIGQCLGRGSLGSTICTSPPARVAYCGDHGADFQRTTNMVSAQVAACWLSMGL